ncbi:G-alpha-domain-containing protein [Trametes versicolor FP-101664 SS1]|uniref:G-alpha-domain-containing protein n=1 Tax=Trametes versicolor (strain FP-101664) TaxID=717944 RepID=UPI00046245F2|nr:G-alpha-domain-containing protein [Trametes versicolor FP-101664 SS1]EIW55448.1 G-alpha-domain-containing protein [Trametes versicolor FP-101664 SS1]
MPAKSKIVTEGDPLAWVMAPPPNESEEQRAGRLAAEAEAKRISDAIDDELQRQAKQEKRGPKPVKILLLGQSESGKSTTLKNFQLMNTPKAFRAERASWRAVVQLNVVRSIRVILDAMAEAQAYHATTYSGPNTPIRTHAPDLFQSPSSSYASLGRPPPPLTAEHLKLKLRLAPLVQVEETLVRKLTQAGSGEMEATQLQMLGGNASHADRARALDREVAVNSQFAWKGVFHKMIGRSSMDSEADFNDPDDPGRILCACAEDMVTLWNDPLIKSLLRSQGTRLEDMPGFFLDSLERVTHPKYVPSDEDILRARLKTLGVSEHRFTIREGLTGGISRDLRIYDVGGHRSLVPAWAPFFDDMNSILFLAPLSGFDQVLAEDESVNRLEDSVLLWKSICSNPLLGKTNLILFLNKIDIFRAKLRAGIQFGQYIISYGNRPNDYENTSAYMRRKFGQIHREYSPQARTFYCHFTSVTDTKSTSTVLVNIQESILSANLKSISLTGD